MWLTVSRRQHSSVKQNGRKFAQSVSLPKCGQDCAQRETSMKAAQFGLRPTSARSHSCPDGFFRSLGAAAGKRAGFDLDRFLQRLWPAASDAGVSREIFDNAVTGLDTRTRLAAAPTGSGRIHDFHSLLCRRRGDPAASRAAARSPASSPASCDDRGAKRRSLRDRCSPFSASKAITVPRPAAPTRCACWRRWRMPPVGHDLLR